MSGVTSETGTGDRSVTDYKLAVETLVGRDIASRLAKVELMVFDADGVLTPGNLIYGPQGEVLKEFHSHDGLGLVMARMVGIKRAVLTGRNSDIVAKRCSELRFDVIKLGRFDKAAAMTEIWQETKVLPENTLYMGDDVIDLPPLRSVGIPVSVPAAPAEVQSVSCYVTVAEGGRGAVREIIDLILKSSGRYLVAQERLLDKKHQPTLAEISDVAAGGAGAGRDLS